MAKGTAGGRVRKRGGGERVRGANDSWSLCTVRCWMPFGRGGIAIP